VDMKMFLPLKSLSHIVCHPFHDEQYKWMHDKHPRHKKIFLKGRPIMNQLKRLNFKG
jgi:hypothetical protein